jgi:hypothetical protein
VIGRRQSQARDPEHSSSPRRLKRSSLTFAVPKGATTGIFLLGTTLSNPVDVSGFGAVQFAAGCNGSVLVAYTKAGGNVEVARFLGGAASGTPATFGGNGVTELGVAADGLAFVTWTTSAGNPSCLASIRSSAPVEPSDAEQATAQARTGTALGARVAPGAIVDAPSGRSPRAARRGRLA